MRKFLAFVLALFVAIPMLVGAMVLISVRSWIVNRDFYKRALTDDRLYSSLDSIPKIDSSETVVIGDVTFNAAALGSAIAVSLPRSEIKKLSGGAVDTVFDVLEGKQKGDAVIDLKQLKAQLGANAGKFSSAYAEGLPQGEAAKFDPYDLSALPKGVSRSAFASAMKPLVAKTIEDSFSRADSRIDLSKVKAARLSSPFRRSLSAGFAVAMVGNLACALALWLLAGFIWPKPWSGRLPFMGGVLVAGSLAIVLIGVGGALAVNAQSLVKALQLFGLPADIMGSGAHVAFKSYFAGLAAEMTRGFFIVGIIGASIGAALVSMRWVAAAREI